MLLTLNCIPLITTQVQQIAAKKESTVLQDLVEIPLNLFNFKNAFPQIYVFYTGSSFEH